MNQLFPPAPFRSPHRRRLWVFDRALLVLVRRLLVPVLLFLGFVLLCVLTYMRLEHLRFADALFWVAHPHAIDYLPRD